MRKLIPVLFLGAALLLLAACGNQTDATPTEEVAPVAPTEEVPAGPVEAPLTVPFLEAWQSSGHADFEAEAFRHWDEDGVVEAACAKCHSEGGYLDFIGADGSAAGTVDAEAALGTTVTCAACHNDVTIAMTSVTMPSGIELTGLGDESRCMQCHQGRASKVTLDTTFEELGLTEDVDTVSADLRFTNIHYYAAAATKYGTAAQGGYEYAGKTYDGFFAHTEGFETCIDCHNSHTLEVKVTECAACHEGVEAVEDLKDVRMLSSAVDYDGDGDMEEGVYYELAGLQEALYTAIQTYANDVAGAAIGYDAVTYPYFYADANANGTLDEGEGGYANWTARLLKAAYNYQMSIKDPGAFAHGGKYIIALLYDSIEDLNTGIDMSAMNRIDHGHFAGSELAFRDWDADGEVPASCSRCHSAQGLPLYIQQGGVAINQPTANGFLCSTCHDEANWPARYEVATVTFPSGLKVTSENLDTNLCMTCHQGRSSANAVNTAVAGKGDDEVFEGRFLNVHYFAAGATRYGSEAAGAAQFPGKTYAGLFEHVGPADDCTDCHNAHTQQVNVETCATCHENVATAADLANIRMEAPDYDGDGDVTEGVAGEIEGLKEVLYAAMVAYSTNTAGTTILYDAHTYPYFLADANGDGVGEGNYATWTPNLLRAAYNYQYASKDPGAYAHNGAYVAQILIDSIEAMGGSTAGMARP